MDLPDDVTSLAPPPLEEFNTEEAAERFLRRWAADHGCGLTRKTFKKDHTQDSQIRRRDLRCAKGGVKRGQGVKRSTGTRMVECPFEVRIYRTGYGTWEVRLPEMEAKQAHTCDASPPAAFSQYRKPTAAQVTRILSLHSNGIGDTNITSLFLLYKAILYNILKLSSKRARKIFNIRLSEAKRDIAILSSELSIWR
jgi:hypothetical protein